MTAPTTISETLYRKYRPQDFDQILGQSEVVSTLQKSIESGHIAHAYLFCGGRGTGKTSIARIFARQLGTDDQDIYEIDAASNRGINEIRQLRDGVANLPFASQYKVYIIDEVHMLTKDAFNALLKTLEEPPQHVIFILATTEKHKVPDTVQSRCQVYDFHLAITENLVELIQHVATQENRTIDQDSVRYVAQLGNGSFRDTLSHLQKIFAVGGSNITYDAVEKIMGQSHDQLIRDFLQSLSDKSSEQIFDTYRSLQSVGMDPKQIVESLLDQVRLVLLLRYSVDFSKQAQETMTADVATFLSDLPGITSHTLRDLLEIYELIMSSKRPVDSFEVFLFEFTEKNN